MTEKTQAACLHAHYVHYMHTVYMYVEYET